MDGQRGKIQVGGNYRENTVPCLCNDNSYLPVVEERVVGTLRSVDEIDREETGRTARD